MEAELSVSVRVIYLFEILCSALEDMLKTYRRAKTGSTTAHALHSHRRPTAVSNGYDPLLRHSLDISRCYSNRLCTDTDTHKYTD